MKLYDTMHRKKLEFKPMEGNKVKMFVCGPTVYDHAHLGHARTYLVFDMLARYLRYKGYSLFYLENITDIDDKIIDRANETAMDPLKLSQIYTDSFFKDMKDLGIDTIHLFAPATQYIDQIIDQVKRLVEMGLAYETDDGVYFDISKFPEYGKLSHQSIDSLKAGARVDINESKRNPLDFVLWKKRKPGEPYWPSPWGDGRPGWHIEDTAITEYYLGAQYDIHGGGSDLIFPHHECEIAQMESISGKPPLVRHWIHTGMINLKGERMGKSIKNAVNIKDLLQKFRKELIRFYIYTSHYRGPQEYTDTSISEIKPSWERVVATYYSLKQRKSYSENANKEFEAINNKFLKDFEKAMDDDLNTSKAISALMIFISWLNKNMDLPTEAQIKTAIRSFTVVDEIFKIIPMSTPELEFVINLLLNLRESLRASKNYELSDLIRSELNKIGITVQDSKEGMIWYFS